MPTKRTKSKTSKTAPLNLQSIFPDYKKKEYTSKVSYTKANNLAELQDTYKHKGLVLYVGAGVSRSLGLPSWAELIKMLTMNMMTKKVNSAIEAFGGISDEKVFEALWKIRSDIETKSDYDKPILMMARSIKDEFDDDLPNMVARNLYRISSIRRVIYRAKTELSPKLPSSTLLDALVTLARSEREVVGVQAIVNYNYDDILDEKLRQDKVKCVTVLSGKDKVTVGALPCYHVHGVLPLNQYRTGKYNADNIGNFVFSEDEYHAEYSDPYRWSNMTQISLLGRYTGLFVGLSLEDPNIRRLIDVTHKQYPEITNYAILPRKHSLKASQNSKQSTLRNIYEDVETRSFAKIGVKVIWVDSFNEIAEAINEICNLK